MDKVCAKCKIPKDTSQFHKSIRDGYKSRCKQCRREDNKSYRSTNSDKDKASKRKWRENNKMYMSEYYQTNKNEISTYHKEYYIENKERIINNIKSYKVQYNKLNPHIIAHRAILGRYLKWIKSKKYDRTHTILGYSANELKTRIESLFKEGMNWENYDKWQIDHIKPVSKFSKDESPSVVNALSNLQPLWKSENLTKGNKYEQ